MREHARFYASRRASCAVLTTLFCLASVHAGTEVARQRIRRQEAKLSLVHDVTAGYEQPSGRRCCTPTCTPGLYRWLSGNQLASRLGNTCTSRPPLWRCSSTPRSTCLAPDVALGSRTRALRRECGRGRVVLVFKTRWRFGTTEKEQAWIAGEGLGIWRAWTPRKTQKRCVRGPLRRLRTEGGSE